MKFRPDIQGIRALAVLLVVLFHLNAAVLPGGFIGVDIFFVISGYLISGIILNKRAKGTFNLLEFYNSRIKRIVPAFLLMILIVAIVGVWIYVISDSGTLRKSLFWSFIFNSNRYFGTLDTYFGASSSENPLLHTWTLAIEMKFYLLLPFLLFFFKRSWIPYCFAILIAILLYYSYYNIHFLHRKSEIYFSLPARIPEFLIGALFVFVPKNNLLLKRPISLFFSIIGLSLILLSAFLLNENSPFPGFLVLWPCIGAALLLITEGNFIKSLLEQKVMVFIGELSYSIYLWHWPLMAFIRYYYATYHFNAFQVFLICITTLVISFLSYRYVENYFRKLNNFSFYKIIAIPLCITLGMIYYSVTINSTISKIPLKYAGPVFAKNSHGKSFTQIDTLGDLSADRDSIVVIGDSYAFAYLPFLDYIGEKNHFKFRTISNDTYPNIPGIDKNDFDEARYLSQYNKLVDITMPVIKESNIIIIASAWAPIVKSLPHAFEAFVKGINGKKKVFVLSDYPLINKNPLRMNRDYIKQNNRDNYEITFRSIPDTIRKICNKYPWVKVIDIQYDRANIDYPFYRDTLMYYDDAHLNEYGSFLLGKLMEKQFMKAFSTN